MWEDIAVQDCAGEYEPSRRAAVCPVLQRTSVKEQQLGVACGQQSRVPADLCESSLSQVWEAVTAAECTGQAIALSAQVCGVLFEASAEQHFVEAVCAQQA